MGCDPAECVGSCAQLARAFAEENDRLCAQESQCGLLEGEMCEPSDLAAIQCGLIGVDEATLSACLAAQAPALQCFLGQTCDQIRMGDPGCDMLDDAYFSACQPLFGGE